MLSSLNTNFTNELSSLLIFTSQLGIHLSYLAECPHTHSNLGMIQALGEFFLITTEVSDIFVNNADFENLSRICEKLLIRIDNELENPILSDGLKPAMNMARTALMSIINKAS